MMQKKKKIDVVTIGGATRDIMFYSDEGELISTGNLTKQKLLAFEYGAKILADKLYFSFGGGAANTAVAFARLGLKAAIFCRVGGDEAGLAAVKNLKANGVDTDFVKIDSRQTTGFSVVLTIDNIAKEHVAFSHRGANDFFSAKELALGKLEAKWLYISSLPKFGWEAIMNEAARTKANLVWNPGGYQLSQNSKLKKFLPKVKLFVVNHDEALEFRRLKDIKGLLRHIYGLGPKLVVITDGEKGAYVYDGQKYYFMKAKGVKPVNTLGVGDAFASGFTSALICGRNIKEALNWGMNNSASVVTHIGAQNGLLTRRRISR